MKMLRRGAEFRSLRFLRIILGLSVAFQSASFRIVRNRCIVKSKFGFGQLSRVSVCSQQDLNDQISYTQLCSLSDPSYRSDEDNSGRQIKASADVTTNNVQQIIIQSIIDDPYRYNLGVYSPLLDSYGFLPSVDIQTSDVDYNDDDDINDYCGVDEIDCDNECMIPDEYKSFNKDQSVDVMAYLGIRRV